MKSLLRVPKDRAPITRRNLDLRVKVTTSIALCLVAGAGGLVLGSIAALPVLVLGLLGAALGVWYLRLPVSGASRAPGDGDPPRE
jgi:1,4-dihydroxy-2-naphthoate octaprenyltransferase